MGCGTHVIGPHLSACGGKRGGWEGQESEGDEWTFQRVGKREGKEGRMERGERKVDK